MCVDIGPEDDNDNKKRKPKGSFLDLIFYLLFHFSWIALFVFLGNLLRNG